MKFGMYTLHNLTARDMTKFAFDNNQT